MNKILSFVLAMALAVPAFGGSITGTRTPVFPEPGQDGVELCAGEDPCADGELPAYDLAADCWLCTAAPVAGLWTDGGVETYLTSLTDRILIGESTATETAKVHIKGETGLAFPVLQLSMETGGVTSPFHIKNGAGGAIAYVDNVGTYLSGVGLDGIGAVDLDYGSADITDHTFATDGTGDTEVVLPADSIGPDEVLTAGQTDDYLLSYELTGNTWKWTDPSSIGGSSPWTAGTHGLFYNGDNVTTSNDVAPSWAVNAGDLDVAGFLEVGEDLHLQGGEFFFTTNGGIGTNKADADDTLYTYLTGGGATTPPSSIRGGYVITGGNEGGSYPGDVHLGSGAVAGADINIKTHHTSSNITLEQTKAGTNNTFVMDSAGFTFDGTSGDNVKFAGGIDPELEGSTSGSVILTVEAAAGSGTQTFVDTTGNVASVSGSATTRMIMYFGAGSVTGGTSWDTGDEVCTDQGLTCGNTFGFSVTPIACGTTHSGPFQAACY